MVFEFEARSATRQTAWRCKFRFVLRIPKALWPPAFHAFVWEWNAELSTVKHTAKRYCSRIVATSQFHQSACFGIADAWPLIRTWRWPIVRHRDFPYRGTGLRWSSVSPSKLKICRAAPSCRDWSEPIYMALHGYIMPYIYIYTVYIR